MKNVKDTVIRIANIIIEKSKSLLFVLVIFVSSCNVIKINRYTKQNVVTITIAAMTIIASVVKYSFFICPLKIESSTYPSK